MLSTSQGGQQGSREMRCTEYGLQSTMQRYRFSFHLMAQTGLAQP